MATRRRHVARLSLATWPREVPESVGIVHLGIGAFHRAHQAVHTEDAGDGWGICGVSQRSPDVVDRLAPQDGLYSVLVRGPGAGDEAARVIGSVREVRWAGADPDAAVARIADPGVRVVSLTVTEKGYRHDPATGRLRLTDPEIAQDVQGRPPRTVIGQVVRGLAARQAPISVLCCDNLPSNGSTLRGLVDDFAGAAGVRITCEVTFPSTMVDRITPATTPADLDAVERLLGLRDLAAVVTEPFSQWVIEDHFAAGRPAWDKGGAIFTGDVAPYESMKLRLLNGAHSTLAYLGALAGFELVSDAIGPLGAAVVRLMDDDVTPTLSVPDGFDLEAYKASLLERFANPALRHRTVQIAMDGSQKLPQRLLGTVRDRLAAGAEPRWAALGVAAWLRYVWAGATDDGAPLPLDDPLHDRLRTAVDGLRDPDAVADALLALEEIFGPDLPDSPVFRALVTDWLTGLSRDGVLGALRG
ncbi:MAG TPA: mannitol dehydrogenase family protein [Streptosporangiaceae bacterium]